MVSVHALRATEVAVSVVHLAFPLLAVGIRAFAHTALGLLNGDVERAHLHMAFLVVASLFLCLGRLGVHLCRGSLYLCIQRLLLTVNIVGHLLQVAKLFAVHLIVSAGIVLALVRSINLDYFLAVNEQFLLVDVSILA